MRVLAEQNRTFGYAVAASAALHACLLLNVPAWRASAPPPVEAPLVAHLMEPAPPAPATPPAAQEPRPPKPAVRPPAPAPKRKQATAKPVPRASTRMTPPAEPKIEDAQRRQDADEQAPREAPAPAPAQQAAPAPAPTAPAAAAAAPSGSLDPEAARERFRQDVLRRAEQIKRYPKRAVDEGWAGKLTVRIEMAGNGTVASVTVQSSSGNALLDGVAVETLGRAASQVAVPPGLRGKAFAVDVPTIYKFTE